MIKSCLKKHSVIPSCRNEQETRNPGEWRDFIPAESKSPGPERPYCAPYHRSPQYPSLPLTQIRTGHNGVLFCITMYFIRSLKLVFFIAFPFVAV